MSKDVLGLDLSMNATGYYLNAEVNGVWKPPKNKARGFERLDWFVQNLNKLVKENNIQFCAVEDFAFAANASRAFDIGGHGYLLRYLLWKKEVASVAVPPTVVKKYATGKGNVKKNEMMLFIYKKWGQEFHDDNIADAYALHRFGLEYFFPSSNETKMFTELKTKVREDV